MLNSISCAILPVDLEKLYDPKKMLKFKLVPPPPPNLPERRVYVLWLVIEDKAGEEESYWDYEAQKMVREIIGGVFSDEDRANFAIDIYQHRDEYISSYIQSVKINELLWKSGSVVK